MSLIEELVSAARGRAKDLPATEPSKVAPSRFREAIRGKQALDVIAEFKRKSPSLGDIASRGLEEQTRAYARAGAAAISVLTEPERFSGSYDDLERAVRAVSVPVLMKDFIVDSAQVRLAAALGASAVLLIVRCLEPSELEDLVSACLHYGRTPLVECHSGAELERALALPTERVVLGVNNRDLDTLEIDRSLSARLIRELVPEDAVVVAESGFESPNDVDGVRGLADAVLVGSALMRSGDAESWIRRARKTERGQGRT
jgi:indole-3-glycerol phosphate synthase